MFLCKEKVNLGSKESKIKVIGVVTSNGMLAFQEPRFTSLPSRIPLNKELEVLNNKFPDPKIPKAFWYEVMLEGKKLYIKDDDVHKDIKFQTFDVLENTRFGFVKSSSVRLREAQSLNSKILENILKETEVQILRTGSQMNEIENKLSHWFYVQLNDGKRGYVFGEYIQDGTV